MKAQPRMRRAALVLGGIAAALAVAALLSGGGPRLLPGAVLAALVSLLLTARPKTAPSPAERTYTERRIQHRRPVRPPRLRADRTTPRRPPPPPAAPPR